MSTITDTDIYTKPVNAMFTRRFLERAHYETHYFAGTVPATIAKHGGTATALWRRYEHLTPTTSALSELTTTVSFPTRNASTNTVTDVTKAVSKYGDHMSLNEEADTFNFNGQTAEIMDVLAEQAGRSLNQIQRNEMEDNATQVRVGGAGSDGAVTQAITAASLNSVINTLQRQVARPFAEGSRGSQATGTMPILRSYWGITHPDVGHDIAGLNGFVSVEKYAGQVDVAPGEFGFYGRAGFGIRFLSTPDASIDAGSGGANSALRQTSSSVDLYSTVIYGQNAFGSLGLERELPSSIVPARDKDRLPAIEIINKPMGSAGAADPLSELASLGWKAWAAAKSLNPNWSRSIRSGATSL